VKQLRKELGKFERMPEQQTERGWIQGWLDTVLALPWTERTEDELDVEVARATLDADHTGLDEVKERIVERPTAVTASASAKARDHPKRGTRDRKRVAMVESERLCIGGSPQDLQFLFIGGKQDAREHRIARVECERITGFGKCCIQHRKVVIEKAARPVRQSRANIVQQRRQLLGGLPVAGFDGCKLRVDQRRAGQRCCIVLDEQGGQGNGECNEDGGCRGQWRSQRAQRAIIPTRYGNRPGQDIELNRRLVDTSPDRRVDRGGRLDLPR
jgi:hypothetical protein